jgi:hypothetical protein
MIPVMHKIGLMQNLLREWDNYPVMKADKILFFTAFVFLMLLSEYAILFADQPVSGQPVIPPVIEPPNSTILSPPQRVLTDNSTLNTPLINKTPVVQPVCTPVALTKTLKDSRLWFTLAVPDNWNATTAWEGGYDTWTGLYFYTNLGVEELADAKNSSALRINSSKIFIMTYTINKNQDQDYRNYYRDNWNPKPVESIENINGIAFDRFESKGEGTAVAYVTRKASANERGLATLIRFYVAPPECAEQMEQIIHSFRYLSAREINTGSAPGIEISIPVI